VVAVNTGYSETEADVRAFIARYKLQMPVVIDDGSLAGKLNLRVTPQHVIIDASGRIVHVGHLDDKELRDALERVATTRPAANTIRWRRKAPQPQRSKWGTAWAASALPP
jgi:hypothetical protein